MDTGRKNIYFLSDFHLGAPNAAASLVREKKIIRFLDTIKNDAAAIFIGTLACLVLALAAAGLVSWLAAGGALLLLGRTAWLLGPWRPAWSARRAGMTEGGLGVSYLILAAL